MILLSAVEQLISGEGGGEGRLASAELSSAAVASLDTSDC